MNIAYKLIKFADKILNIVIYLCLIIVFLFCLYALFDTIKVYLRASNQSIIALKPTEEDPIDSLNRLKEINEDVCGWITIDDTNIDYPIVIGKNNSEYLNKDVYKNYSLAGSIYLDYRNSRDFSDIYSIIFGHHMDGGAMFGDIRKFSNKSFFNTHTTGTLYTENGVYRLSVFALMNTDAYDSYIYGINKSDISRKQELIEYAREKAINYRELNIKDDERIICLSTCSSATTNGRDVLLVKINY